MAVDFTESFFFDARAILSRKGFPEINPWGFLYPLTWSVWAALLVALAVVWLATVLVGRRPGASVSLDWAGEVFLQNVRVFLNQGGLMLSKRRAKSSGIRKQWEGNYLLSGRDIVLISGWTIVWKRKGAQCYCCTFFV